MSTARANVSAELETSVKKLEVQLCEVQIQLEKEVKKRKSTGIDTVMSLCKKLDGHVQKLQSQQTSHH